MIDLTAQESHFAFGENWQSFASLVDMDRIARSDAGLAGLFEPGELTGKRAIDIGCGSGLPALSMLRAGAEHVTCVDIDPESVRATAETLSRFAPVDAWAVRACSVFDLTESYDVVYSWGVLHHTGDMWRAIDKAAGLVKPGGLLAIAVYFKTPLCGFWTAEKRFYAHAPKWAQRAIRGLYYAIYFAAKIAKGRNPFAEIRNYGLRGMNWWHDVHDWLGGYPYESASPEEICDFLAARGLARVRERLKPGKRRGIGGSGCDEFVLRRP